MHYQDAILRKDMNTKICKACNLTKSIDEFDDTKNTKDGKENKCSKCRKEQRKKSAAEKQLKIASGQIILKNKICIRCKTDKSIENFSSDKSRGDGYETTCKSCKGILHNQYMSTETGKEKSRERSLKYWANHPGAREEYYQKNKESINKRTSEYHASFDGRYYAIKAQATQREIEFQLTKEFVDRYWDSSCVYCSTKLDMPRFDRVDSSIGYLETNVVPCCSICNYMKMARDKDFFISHVKRIYNYEWKIAYAPGSFKNKQIWHITAKAREKDLDCEITKEVEKQFHDSLCYYCGSRLDFLHLDRINPSLGYTLLNVLPCCWDCNDMKGELSQKDFTDHCKKIVEFNESL